MKGKKILKCIGIILLILVIFVILFILRNYIIISKLAKMQKHLAQKSNYSYIREFNDGENKSVAKFYHNGTYDVETYDVYTNWYDEETKELITINTVNKKAEVFSNREREYAIPTAYDKDSVGDKLEASISIITREEVNGKECYVIHPMWGLLVYDYYVSVEDGTLVRMSNEKFSKDNVKVIDYTDYTFDEVTDEFTARPDLTDYEVTNVN